jgi:hypothetical protein
MELTVFRNVGIWNSDAGNHPKERLKHSEHGECLKSRTFCLLWTTTERWHLMTSSPVWQAGGPGRDYSDWALVTVWLKDGVIYKHYITLKLGKGYSSVGYLWNYTERGKPKYLEKELTPCHPVHHKCHTGCLRVEYPDWCSSCFLSDPPGKFWDSTISVSNASTRHCVPSVLAMPAHDTVYHQC